MDENRSGRRWYQFTKRTAIDLESPVVGGNIYISSGNNSDEVTLRNVALRGNLTINGLDGNDRIDVRLGTAPNTTGQVGGNLMINGGAHNDSIRFSGDLYGNADFLGSTGLDSFALLNIDFEDDVTNQTLTVTGGDSNDSITLIDVQDNSTSEQNVFLNGNFGNDTVNMTNSGVGGNLTVSLGGDDDSAQLYNNTIDGNTTLNGGSEFDRLAGADNTFGSNPTITGFEDEDGFFDP